MPNDGAGEDVTQQPTQDRPQGEIARAPLPPDDPSRPTTESVSKQSEKTEIQQIEDRVRRAERWMIWLTGAIAFFGLCQVLVGVFQWSAMKGQLSEMAKQYPELRKSAGAAEVSAHAADTAVKQAGNALHLDQRAWVAVSDVRGTDFQIGQPFIITVALKNTGKTPAKDMLVASAVDPVRKGSNPDFTDRTAESRGLLPPGGEANIKLKCDEQE